MFEWITGVISAMGVAGVATLTFLENVFPPIPSEVVIPLAGFAAARGEMPFAWVVAAGSAGSLAGAWAWYELGRRIGEERLRRWVIRHGKWLTIDEGSLDRAKGWFDRHGRLAVFLGRLVPGVRTFISLPAGFNAMPVGPFLAYSALGTIVWTTLLAAAGLVLQANFSLVSGVIDAASTAVLLGLVLLLVVRYVKCWRASREQSDRA